MLSHSPRGIRNLHYRLLQVVTVYRYDTSFVVRVFVSGLRLRLSASLSV